MLRTPIAVRMTLFRQQQQQQRQQQQQQQNIAHRRRPTLVRLIPSHRYYNTTAASFLSTTSSSSTATSTSIPCHFQEKRIAATQLWFHKVVIGEKLCPFAPPLLRPPSSSSNADSDHGTASLRYVCAKSETTRAEAIQLVAEEVEALVETIPTTTTTTTTTDEHEHEDKKLAAISTHRRHRSHETTLVVLDHPNWTNDFREFVRLSWDLQEQAVVEAGHVGKLQLVLFHPQATHQTYGTTMMMGEEENPADYTIRSPYPTVHLLREMDVMRAVQSNYPNLDTLPQRNQQKLIQQGLEICQTRLADCYTTTPRTRKYPGCPPR